MPTNREALLCRYHYDPLDRLAACTLSEQVSTQRFYQKIRLATEIQGLAQHSIFQHDDHLLAQQQRQSDTVETTLLATDQQRSVLNALAAPQPHLLAYTPYGHRPPDGGLLSLLGFNGERPDPVTGHYLLGNGYRAFNPVLMRFNSPDSLSPFGKGGLNAYGYCTGDPVNFTDPTGHFISKLINLANNFNRALKTSRPISTNVASRAPGGMVDFFDDMVTTVRNALTRDETFTSTMSPARQYLDDIITTVENPDIYVRSLRDVNKNLASHGSNALTMSQAEELGTLVQHVSVGEISNTTAHVQEAFSWGRRFVLERDGGTFAGATLNIAATGLSGAVDAKNMKTGLSIRRGSAVIPR